MHHAVIADCLDIGFESCLAKRFLDHCFLVLLCTSGKNLASSLLCFVVKTTIEQVSAVLVQ